MIDIRIVVVMKYKLLKRYKYMYNFQKLDLSKQKKMRSQIYRIMRLTCFILIFFMLPISATVYSQVTKLDVRMENVSVKDVFKSIEAQSEFRFFYSDDLGFVNQRITVDMKNVTVDDVLSKMLDQSNLTYRIFENNLIVVTPVGTIRQGIVITGKVTDEKGESLPGASVVIKGTTQGTVTDFNGAYTFSVPNADAVLVFSFMGYTTQEVIVGDRRSINVTLREDTQQIEEVVVVGYGTQRRINLTGAVDVVSSEVFENRSMSNTSQALQGVVPNLNISLEDGKPTRSANFNIRGTTSIGQGGSALVMIDGVEGDPAFLNPNDIESVTVLKDAASAAVYGARGAFGVVLITTKQPQKGKTTVNYTGNYSFQSIARNPEFVTDAVTYLEHFRAAYVGRTGTVPGSINNDIQAYNDEWLERMREWKASGQGPKVEILPDGSYEYYSNTDWFALLHKDRTLVQDHNLNVSGGNEKSTFYVSGRYYDFGGLYNFDPDVYKSYNLRAKGSLKAYDWLELNTNAEYANTFYHMPYQSYRRDANIIRMMQVESFPSMPMYNPDGSFTRAGAGTLGAFVHGNNYEDNDRKLFKNTIGFRTNFLNNTLRVIGDYTYRYDSRERFYKRMPVPYYEKITATSPTMRGNTNQIYEAMWHTMYTASNVYAEYENTFAQKHYLKAMAGWNYETSTYKGQSIRQDGLYFENAESFNLAEGEDSLGASYRRWRTAGTFFRLNYAWMNRYLLEVNGRYDGSSRFPTEQQWGFFPSISGGWRLSEEPFWNVSKDIISDVKFRVSYGSLGNGNISPYAYLEELSFNKSGLLLDGALNRRTQSSSPIPTGLTWERATTSNFGLDMGFLKGRLRFNGDYYIRRTTDMYTVGPELPQIFGAGAPKGNYAAMTTNGFELTLSWQDNFSLAGKPFRYQVRGMLFDYVSTIDKFYNPTKRFTQHYEGKIIGELWGFRTDGLFQEDPAPSDYINTIYSASGDNMWRAGDLKVRKLDKSGDNMITKGEQTVDNPGDMTIIGNTEPRYQYSFTANADWNGFFFSVFFQGVGKQNWDSSQGENSFWGQYNRGYNQIPAWHIGNYWTPDNRNAYLPRYAQSNNTISSSGGTTPNDRYMQNVAYLRLKNIQIGYSLPQAWISKISMKSAKIYISGENLASWSPIYKVAKNFMDVSTIQGYTDSDQDSSYNDGPGNVYPLLKTVSLGISLTF